MRNKKKKFNQKIKFKEISRFPSIRRDLALIVDNSIKTDKDILIGSGELINVKNFIQDLFNLHNKKFEDYISVEGKNNLPNTRKDYYSCVKYSNYEDLLNLTIKDIYEYKIS